jgi:hypothetical protein
MKSKITFCILSALFLFPAFAQAFSFSEEAAKEQQAAQAKANYIVDKLSSGCKAGLKGKTIAVLIAERSAGQLRVAGHGVLQQALNGQLAQLGLGTVPQSVITAKIAAAETAAILNNDPDAALAASSRLGASFFLKGIISSRAGQNKMVNANEVAVTIALTLTDGRGRTISSRKISAESWAGQDVLGVAESLVEDNGPVVVAELYSDYCARAGK